VLLDRDGTLLVDVAYNGDPSMVELMPTAREALTFLREHGVPTALVSNQSGVARGLIDRSAVDAVNSRMEALLGTSVGPKLVCVHGPGDGCRCRKPAPGLILAAAERLGVHPSECAVIGDIGSDMEAARAAGARGVLVPTAITRRQEIEAAQVVAPNLLAAVRALFSQTAREELAA
jgi:D-glycero-D-manno-heptose 1,7-bisphosphate phosphatase